MNISKKSWHYRWVQVLERFTITDHRDARTLCHYFWRFVGLNILAFFLAVMILFFAFLIPALLWSAFHNHSRTAEGTLEILSAGIGFIFILFVLSRLVDKIKDSADDKPMSMLAVVLQMTRVVKEKVCPFIKYQD
jgi:hypothetical protein